MLSGTTVKDELDSREKRFSVQRKGVTIILGNEVGGAVTLSEVELGGMTHLHVIKGIKEEIQCS